MKLIYALAFLPFAAFSNPLTTDFEQVFSDNADRAVQKDGAQSVELDGKIILSRRDDGEFIALDGSPHQAVGCILSITLQSRAVERACPEAFSAEHSAIITNNIEAMADFYAANNVPARDLVNIKTAFEQAIGILGERFVGLQCDTPVMSHFQKFVAGLTSEASQKKLSDNLATPRLPVADPCL